MTTLGLSDRRQSQPEGNGRKRAWGVVEKVLGTVGAVAVLSLFAILWRAGWLVAEVPELGLRVQGVEAHVGQVDKRVQGLEAQVMSPELAKRLAEFLDEQRRERDARRKR